MFQRKIAHRDSHKTIAASGGGLFPLQCVQSCKIIVALDIPITMIDMHLLSALARGTDRSSSGARHLSSPFFGG
jgi:hypothetical protein